MADGRVIIEAILDTANVVKNVKNLGQQLDGISWKNIAAGDEKAQALGSAFKDAGTACTLKLTAPIIAAGTAAFSTASDYEQATARIQSALGTTRGEAERFRDIGAAIYEDGWGESLDEVTMALIQTKGTIRDIDDEGLRTVTQNALVFASTLGADVNETIRGTNALMEGFGLSATEASDLMAAGMQRGLNYTDELGDNLSEYSVRWGEAGISASEYFSLLEAGTSNGAYNLDKVGDYLNEFLTSLSDGRMEESMGKFSQSTKDVWASYKTGGATAKDVLDAVLGEMAGMTDETERAAIAGELWSSLGEDNAMGMILSLAGVTDSYSDVEGAAKEAGDAASDSFAAKSASAMRELMGAIEPLGEPMLRIAEDLAGLVSDFAEWFASLDEGSQNSVLAIAGMVAAIGPLLSITGSLVGNGKKIVDVVGGVLGVVSPLGGTAAAAAGGVGDLAQAAGDAASKSDALGAAAETAGGKAGGAVGNLARFAGAAAAIAAAGYISAEATRTMFSSNADAAGRFEEIAGKAYEYANSLGTVDANADGVIDAADLMAQGLGGADEALENGNKKLAGFVSGMQDVDEESKGALGALRGYFGVTEDNVSYAMDNIAWATKEGWGAALAATQASGGEISEDTRQTALDMIKAVSGLPPEYSAYGDEAMRALAASMAPYWPELADYSSMSASEICTVIKDKLSSGLDEAGSEFQLSGQTAVEQIASGLQHAAEGGALDGATYEAVNALLDGFRSGDLPEGMQEAGTESMRQLASGLSDQWPELAEYATMTGDEIIAAIEERLSGTYVQGTNAVQNLASGINEKRPDAGVSAEQLASVVSAPVDALAGAMGGKGISATNNYARGVGNDEAKRSVRNSAGQVISAADSEFSSANFSPRGESAGRGFAAGLAGSAVLRAVSSAASKLVGATNDAIRRAQGENSPARVFRPRGRMGGEGYAEGWKESYEDVRRSARGAVEAASSALSANSLRIPFGVEATGLDLSSVSAGYGTASALAAQSPASLAGGAVVVGGPSETNVFEGDIYIMAEDFEQVRDLGDVAREITKMGGLL